MEGLLRSHAEHIVKQAIAAVLPDEAVCSALLGKQFPGRVFLVAVGKAAWQMASAAYQYLGASVSAGIVITKYHHSKGPIGNLEIYEAGHPVPDENSFAAAKAALVLVKDLEETDTVVFLLSGGGSALFELPLIAPEELEDITRQLLASGAEIGQVNTVRKHLSGVKGGRFAQACMPAQVYSIVLSDVLGDRLDVIASGPAYPDSSTSAQALEIVEQYGIRLSAGALACLSQETPKELRNVTSQVNGSVRTLCAAAEEACRKLGYRTCILTDHLTCQAREAGNMLAATLQEHAPCKQPLAFIAGGETVVQLGSSTGLGGRNQELALSAVAQLADIYGAAVFSVGSDGTDGPTDAAGGYVDFATAQKLRQAGVDLQLALANHDAYHALQAVNGLIVTGPTGTNVNDVAVALLQP